MTDPDSPRRADDRHVVLAAVLAAVAAVLPLLPVLLAGQSLYFRDLGRYYFPLRRFVVDGLAQGEIRYWNPFVHEGLHELFPPISYPLDLLQPLTRDESGLTLLLALHLPLAAVGFFWLARTLSLSAVGAAGGAVAYALGGFSLSSLNLYEYTQALAWAPIVAVAYLRAAEAGGRWLVAAAVATATVLSTGRVEVAAQALVVAVVLARPGRDRHRWGRVIAAGALGAFLASPTLMAMRAAIDESRRGAGLDLAVMLARSVHPISLVQTLVGNLHGDLVNLVGRWWGDNFFEPGTFPYFLSLYLGPCVIGLAALAAVGGGARVRPLLVLAALALWVALGPQGGLRALLEVAPEGARALRFPSKAFFTVHFCVALLAALGLDALVTDTAGRRWRAAAGVLGSLGLVLVALVLLPHLPDSATDSLRDLLFPPHYGPTQKSALLGLVAADAAKGGALALVAALAALAAARRRVSSTAGAALLAAVLGADLLRAGAGLNPSVTTRFFEPSLEMAETVERLRREGGRVFTCRVPGSRAYQGTRPKQWDQIDVWTFAVMRETLVPYFNVRDAVRSAYGDDLTMLVPLERVSPPGRGECAAVPAILDELRRSGVSHVLSLDAIDHPDLLREDLVRPERIAPLAIHVYAVRDPLPLRFVARSVVAVPRSSAVGLGASPSDVVVEGGVPVTEATGRVLAIEERTQEIRLRVEADRPTVVVVRDAWARGWSALVNGRPEPVLRANGRHRAVPVPTGVSDVVLRYRPPGLGLGIVLSALSAVVLAGLWIRGRPPAAAGAGNPR